MTDSGSGSTERVGASGRGWEGILFGKNIRKIRLDRLNAALAGGEAGAAAPLQTATAEPAVPVVTADQADSAVTAEPKKKGNESEP